MDERTRADFTSPEATLRYLDGVGIPGASQFRACPGTGRHLHAQVTVRGRRLHLKQGAHDDAVGDGALLSEGLFHALAAELDLTGPGSVLAHCVLHDRRSDVLVFHQLCGPTLADAADTADTADARPDRMPARAHGDALGEALGRLHERTSRPASTLREHLNPALGAGLPSGVPLSGEQYASMGAAELAVVAELQDDALVRASLVDLDASWLPTCVVHGDLRLDNVLLQDGDPAHVRILDWELARLGDPALDLGTVVGTCLDHVLHRAALAGLPLPATRRAEAVRDLLPSGVAAWRPFLVAFLAAHRRSSAGLPGACTDGILQRALRHAGAHLLHRAAAKSQLVDRLGPDDAARLSLARSLLLDPAGSGRTLLLETTTPARGGGVGAARSAVRRPVDQQGRAARPRPDPRVPRSRRSAGPTPAWRRRCCP